VVFYGYSGFFSRNKAVRYDITVILLKVALNTINHQPILHIKLLDQWKQSNGVATWMFTIFTTPKHRVINKTNTMDATIEAGTTYTSEAPEFTHDFVSEFLLLILVFCSSL
jgi:hypothetical protein